MNAALRITYLEDVATIDRTGIAAADIISGTPYIGLEHIEAGGRILSAAPVENGDLASNKFVFTPQHVLYGKLRPYLAKIATPDFSGICSTDIVPILPGPNLDRSYLTHFLRQPSMVAYATSRSEGINLPRLSPKALAKFEIPVPSLDEQRRIAAILDKADALRQKRKRAIALLDSLTQSIFLEMFGDSAQRGKVIASLPLSKLGKVHTGKTPPTARPELFVGEIPFITPGDLEVRAAATKRSISPEGAQFTRVVPSGSAMVCCIGATIGKMDMARTASAFNQQINAVEWSSKINPIYGLQALRQKRGEVISRSISTTLPILKKSEFEKIEILLPDIDLQREFASRIGRVLFIEATQRRQFLQAESLFASLQHRAFSGQL